MPWRLCTRDALIVPAMLGGMILSTGVPLALADPVVQGAGNPTVTLKATPSPGKSEFRIRGLDPKIVATLKAEAHSPDAWKNLIAVSVDAGGSSKAQLPILGTYRVDQGDVIFSPRYAIDRSITRYRILIDGALIPDFGREPRNPRLPLASGKREIIFLVTHLDRALEPVGAATVVDAVFPTASTLPENTLRFYIAFSSPMSRGGAYEHLRLLDENGHRIVDPFLELDEELWSIDGKRFTLLIDPGRIKRGLKPREEVGPVLQAGRGYTLIVGQGWLDAKGNQLRREFRKSFRVGPADEQSPDPRHWTIRSPKAGTTDPLVVDFHEPLDHALAERLIVAEAPGGRLVKAGPSLDSAESVWKLKPTDPWKSGDYHLLIGSELEDLAGNSVGRQFEVDLVEPITSSIRSSNVRVPFQIKAEAR